MRFRANSIITWEFESNSPEEAEKLANHYLEFFSKIGIKELRSTLRLDKLKDKVEKIKLGEFKTEEVFPFLDKENKKTFQCNGVDYLVKLNSQRYFVFKEHMSCVACGLLGTKMILECYPNDKNPHFNLYGEEDGELILMTKDHICSKYVGGEDQHSNYQSMCLICNNLKGHVNLNLDGVKELRSIFNENKKKLTKKQLFLLIEESKRRLAQPIKIKSIYKNKITPDTVISVCDINLYKNNQDLVGKSVYDHVPENYQHIGCIKKGTYFEVLLSMKNKLLCRLFEEESVILHERLVKTKVKT